NAGIRASPSLDRATPSALWHTGCSSVDGWGLPHSSTSTICGRSGETAARSRGLEPRAALVSTPTRLVLRRGDRRFGNRFSSCGDLQTDACATGGALAVDPPACDRPDPPRGRR